MHKNFNVQELKSNWLHIEKLMSKNQNLSEGSSRKE